LARDEKQFLKERVDGINNDEERSLRNIIDFLLAETLFINISIK
jgi:hypothetical protein